MGLKDMRRLTILLGVVLMAACTPSEDIIETNPVPPVFPSLEQPKSDATPLIKVTEYGQCETTTCFEYTLKEDGNFTVNKANDPFEVASGSFGEDFKPKSYETTNGLILLQDRLCNHLKTDIKFEFLTTPANKPTQFTCTKTNETQWLSNYGLVEHSLSIYHNMQGGALKDLDPIFTKEIGTLVFDIAGSGGCAWGRNRCQQHQIFDSGKFVTKRLGTDIILASGQVDKDLMEKWQKTTDYQRLYKIFESLGEGQCLSCLDGIDTYYWIYTPDGILTVDSLSKGFNSDKFFEYSFEIGQAIRKNSTSLSLHGQK